MLRHHAIIALLLLCGACAAGDPEIGAGRITLSPAAKANFEAYKAEDAPIYFVVTASGSDSYYIYCEGGFNCTGSAARAEVLDLCRRQNPDEDCKIYAIGRVVVWQEPDAPRPGPQLTAAERLVRDCLAGDTPEVRIDNCSQVIASPELVHDQKRSAFYVRARAYEQMGKTAEAQRDYRAVLSIDPDHSNAKARLANLRGADRDASPTRPNST